MNKRYWSHINIIFNFAKILDINFGENFCLWSLTINKLFHNRFWKRVQLIVIYFLFLLFLFLLNINKSRKITCPCPFGTQYNFYVHSHNASLPVESSRKFVIKSDHVTNKEGRIKPHFQRKKRVMIVYNKEFIKFRARISIDFPK